MYEFDEQALREGIRIGLGSQGIWTPKLETIMFNEIQSKALRIHGVVGRSEQLKAFMHFAEFAKQEYGLHIPLNLMKEYVKSL